MTVAMRISNKNEILIVPATTCNNNTTSRGCTKVRSKQHQPQILMSRKQSYTLSVASMINMRKKTILRSSCNGLKDSAALSSSSSSSSAGAAASGGVDESTIHSSTYVSESSTVGKTVVTLCHDDSSTRSGSSFSRNDGTETSQPIVQQKSCMKSGRDDTIGGRTGTTRRKKNLRIRFKRSIEHVILIEPYFAYATDLWYTKMDKIGMETLSLDSINTISESSYMLLYNEAREQVCSGSNNNNTNNKRPELISKRLYNEIVQGRICGYAGIENYLTHWKQVRRQKIRHTILTILWAYNEAMNNHTKDHSTSSSSPSSSSSDCCIAKKVRKCSTSLTQADRYWATAMGQADADAIMLEK